MHYVNLPHLVCFKSMPAIVLGGQHAQFGWFDLQLAATDEGLHPFIKN